MNMLNLEELLVTSDYDFGSYSLYISDECFTVSLEEANDCDLVSYISGC